MEDKVHVFICFSSKDEAIARRVVQSLEASRLKCWVSFRDVPPGQNYQETIVRALELAKAVVFLFSESSGASGEIKKELSLAAGLNAPVFPLRLSPILPTGALRYELATRQWIDIFPDAEPALRKLAESIRKVLNAPGAGKAKETGTGGIAATTPSVATVSAPAPAPATPSLAKKHIRKAREPVVAPGSAEFEAIRVLLAHHIGPIAKVFVQKAATDASTPDDFCERLAAHVSAPPARAAFLRAARAQLSIKA